MKLLFDENLSFRLVERLTDTFPGSCHVSQVGLKGASDLEVWQFAQREGYCIVTKDGDFSHLSVLHGSPPFVVRLEVGNTGTSGVADLLRKASHEVEALTTEGDSSLLVLPARKPEL